MSEVRTKLDSLLGTSGTGKGVKEKSPLPGIPPSVGIGMPKVSGGVGSGSGGDLTETSFMDREYYPGVFLTTSDGLFQFQAIKRAKFTDALGNSVIITFASPT